MNLKKASSLTDEKWQWEIAKFLGIRDLKYAERPPAHDPWPSEGTLCGVMSKEPDDAICSWWCECGSKNFPLHVAWFPEDGDAMAFVIGLLNKSKKKKFRANLVSLFDDHSDALDATARQKCLAFIMTILP